MLAEGATQTELAGGLSGVFGISEETAGADIEAFLEELESRNLLIREEA